MSSSSSLACSSNSARSSGERASRKLNFYLAPETPLPAPALVLLALSLSVCCCCCLFVSVVVFMYLFLMRGTQKSTAPEPHDAVRPPLLPNAARYWEGSVRIQPNLPPGCKSSNGHGSRVTPWIRR